MIIAGMDKIDFYYYCLKKYNSLAFEGYFILGKIILGGRKFVLCGKGLFRLWWSFKKSLIIQKSGPSV